jgi:hypothetical protein
VKVTTPLELDEPLAAEMVELPLPWDKVTVFPLTGLLFPSLSVTVIVEVVVPSATIEVGLAFTVEVLALTPLEVMLNALLVVWVNPLLVAVSV